MLIIVTWLVIMLLFTSFGGKLPSSYPSYTSLCVLDIILAYSFLPLQGPGTFFLLMPPVYLCLYRSRLVAYCGHTSSSNLSYLRTTTTTTTKVLKSWKDGSVNKVLEGLSLSPQNLCENLGMVVHACNLKAGDMSRWVPEA